MRITENMRGNGKFKGGKVRLPRVDFPIGIAVGSVLGLVLLILGPKPTVAMLLGLVYLLVLVNVPEVPMLTLLAYTSGLLPASLNPYINLVVGHFQVSDLILLSLLGLTMLRAIAEPTFKIRQSPVNMPLFLLCLSVFIGMGTAVLKHGIGFSHTTYEARILLYYSIFFAVVNLIQTRAQLTRLVYGVFGIGILTAILIILQTISVPSFFQPEPSLSASEVVRRAFHPGFTSILMTIMAFVCLLGERHTPLNEGLLWLTLLVLGSSILLSLGRNIILSVSLTLLVLLLIVGGRQRVRLMQSFFVLVAAAALAFGLLQQFAPSADILEYPKALVERFAHLITTDPLSPQETLLWRIQETEYAWEKIVESPLLGIGLKTEYRPEFYEGDTLKSYIHNGYLWLWLKTGLLGLLSFLWMLTAFIAHALRRWKNITDLFFRMSSLGFTLVLFAIAISNFVAPVFVERFNLAFFAVGMGIFELSLALESEPQ